MEDKKEKIRELRKDFRAEKPDKIRIVALAVASVGIALAITVTPGILAQDSPDASTTINITEWSAEPARPAVSEGESVRFINNADSSVRLEFERGAEPFSLDPGGSAVKQFEMSVYYTVLELEPDQNQRINAGIAVE
ncbi:MAG: hypothetical protein ACI8Z7_000845 [Candidatus Nanohaloarchaea archaeon]|jgi:hypothetical protein